jgi:uncharacterized membrane protein YhiD involved in acid resistance
MPDWLQEAVTLDQSFSPTLLGARLFVALLLGGVIAAIFRGTHGRNSPDAPVLATTLVLLCVLIAMVSMVIGNSVARAFSLVGALSIVRFRTVVDDTRDTAFVIFAVIVGMAVGTGQMLLPIVGIPIVGLAAGLLNGWPKRLAGEKAFNATLSVRLGLGRSADELLAGVLLRHVEESRITSSATARQGAALDVTYLVRLKPDADLTLLVAELNQLEGVVGVELRRQ